MASDKSGPAGDAATGIAGLDDILGGGLKRNRVFLIEGSPGTGKTTAAMSFLLAGAKAGEPTLYVTLSETEDELRDTAASHGWDLEAQVCIDVPDLRRGCEAGAGAALIVEEVLAEDDYAQLARWVDEQPAWSDFPIIILARRGAGLERNPAVARFSHALGNVSFLERPFHPTTLVSMAQTALRGRRRQYEARERLEALRAAVRRQKDDQAHLRLMLNELNHRVKNTLATVQSIVAQTLRSADASPRTRDILTSRILALSKAHDVLTSERWAGADLWEIATQAAVPFRSGSGDDRIVLDGPRVRLPPKAAIAVALAFHELATNAVKYGALSTPEGHVAFRWRLQRQGGHQDLTIVWREIDGPHVVQPVRAGFGARLIERGLASDLNGDVRIDYPANGVVCTIHARLDDAPPPTAFLPERHHRSRRDEDRPPPDPRAQTWPA